MKKNLCVVLTTVLLLFIIGSVGAVEHVYYHKIGTLWTTITNWGCLAQEYQITGPRFEWPGGSGNYYVCRSAIWFGGIVQGDTVLDNADGYPGSDFAPTSDPSDTILVNCGIPQISDEDTYCAYSDTAPPNPCGGQRPGGLGLAVTERTYAWKMPLIDDFIIYDYWIKNVGGDTIKGLFLGWRIDADLTTAAPNTDLKEWDDYVGFDSTTGISYMWDGDSRTTDEDDTGNPDPTTGELLSPGYVGIKMLEIPLPYTWPTVHRVIHRYNDPPDDKAQYKFLASCIIDTNFTFPFDYRFCQAVGPYDLLLPGDSMHIVIAIGVGLGLEGLRQNLMAAQGLHDADYVTAAAPPSPELNITDSDAGVILNWDDAAESFLDPLSGLKDFEGYIILRSNKVDASGAVIWYPDTFTIAQIAASDKAIAYFDSTGNLLPKNWPPAPSESDEPGTYRFVDTTAVKGFDYWYALLAFDSGMKDTAGTWFIEPLPSSRYDNVIHHSPTNTVKNVMDEIAVVPNPFVGSAQWNNPSPRYVEPWEDKIRFINLPEDAVIRIYTLDGDFVRELKAGDRVRAVDPDETIGKGSAEWNLISRNDQLVSTGVYLYVVESKLGKKIGKFMVIR